MRTVRRLAGVAIVLMLATTAMPPAAHADHYSSNDHEPPPTDADDYVVDTDGVCIFSGWTQLSDNDGSDHVWYEETFEMKHNHYQNSYISVSCSGISDSEINQSFDVYMNGGTDGAVPLFADHGENEAQSWSHSSGYGEGFYWEPNGCDDLTDGDHTNKGTISFNGSPDFDGWVKFVRVGTQIQLWGCAIHDYNEEKALIFQLHGEFTDTYEIGGGEWFYLNGTGTAGIRDLSPPPTTTTTTSTTTTSTTTSSTTTTTMPPPEVPLVDTVPSLRASDSCKANGGTRIVDTTSLGVESTLYTYQPSAEELWVCTRVEDTGSGDGAGGRLEVTPAGGAPSISGGPGDPSVDEASSACTTTTDPPNQIPTTHPISHGGIGPVDYMIDAYSNDSEAWVCLQVDDTDARVVVPFDDPVPEVSFGTMVTWHPDEGTPPS